MQQVSHRKRPREETDEAYLTEGALLDGTLSSDAIRYQNLHLPVTVARERAIMLLKGHLSFLDNASHDLQAALRHPLPRCTAAKWLAALEAQHRASCSHTHELDSGVWHRRMAWRRQRQLILLQPDEVAESMAVVVPCIGAASGREPVQPCGRCFCVKFVKDLAPELSWKCFQACPSHNQVQRDRHAGYPQLATALAKQCAAITLGTLEPLLIFEFPVQLRQAELHPNDELLASVNASTSCIHGPRCSGVRTSCSSLVEITADPESWPADSADNSDSKLKRTRFDVCVCLRRVSTDTAAPAAGDAQHSSAQHGAAPRPPHGEAGGAAEVPVVFIEVAGPSIRNRAQRETMHAKMQACLDPDAVQVMDRPWGLEDGSGANCSLFFVASSDLEAKRFRRVVSHRILLACMHEGVWGAVPMHAKAHRLRRRVREQAGNSALITYTSQRRDLWGGFDEAETDK